MTTTIYTLEDIPQSVLTELNEKCQTVKFDNYGSPVTDDCVSRRLDCLDLVEENGEYTTVDVLGTTTKTVYGNKMQGYLVRGKFENNQADIYAVIPAGYINQPSNLVNNK